MSFEELIIHGASAVGLSPSALGAVVLASNFISRAIPDDKRGPLGVVRKVTRVLSLGLNSRNRRVSEDKL
jgi:hypothetical protein